MQDKIITCVQCGDSFVFAVPEQERFLARGFGVPKRCPECRKKKAKGVEIDDGWKDKGRKRHSRRQEEHILFE